MSYRVFVRNWWRIENGALVPDPAARKTTLHKRVENEDDARRLAMEYNATHKPGKLSRKAEYTEN